MKTIYKLLLLAGLMANVSCNKMLEEYALVTDDYNKNGVQLAAALQNAIVIAGWRTAAGTTGAHAATTNDANLETATLSRGPGLTYNNSSSNSYVAIFPIGQTKEMATSGGSYFQVTIQAKSGHYVSLKALDARLRRASATSVDHYRWSYSLDGVSFKELGPGDVFMTATSLDDNNGEVQGTINLSGVADLQYVPSSVVITFRMHAWGATEAATSSNFGFGKYVGSANSLEFTGTVENTLPAQYNVTFDSDGGTTVSPVQVYSGVTMNEPVAPTKVGYGFGGWYRDAELTNSWDFTTDVVTEDMTLYARWNDPDQVISFGQIEDKVYGSSPFMLDATANSRLPVSYEALTSNISISGNIVTILAPGEARIKATQAGDSFYNPATPVEVSFQINKGFQTISFAQAGPYSRYIGTVELIATSSSGLPVSFTASEPTVAVLDGATLHVKGLGQIAVTVTQEGNDFYLPAEPVTRIITIHTVSSLQLLINKALSPNGDGINDIFLIEGIKSFDENQVKIMNSRGVEVFNKKGYDNETIVFEGKNDRGYKLPAGTYYYLVEVRQGQSWLQEKGYIVLRY